MIPFIGGGLGRGDLIPTTLESYWGDFQQKSGFSLGSGTMEDIFPLNF